MPFEFAFGRKPLATALMVGGFLALSAPAAHAQFFNFFFHSDGLDPSDVQSMLEDRGLALVAPLRRNGGVYVADVEGPRGGHMRVIVDAESGRIVQRFRVGAPHYYSDYAGPRPPGEMGEPDSGTAAGAPPAVITFGQSLARGDDATSSPNVLPVPNAGEEAPKLRPKSPVKPHRKIELTPVPQPAQSASSPAPEAKPPVHAEAASPAPAPSKAAPSPAPPPAAAAAPSSAPAAPAASSKAKPAVNDVPVTPLD
jgi:hypothetical protein